MLPPTSSQVRKVAAATSKTSVSTKLHDGTFQQTAIFIATMVRNSIKEKINSHTEFIISLMFHPSHTTLIVGNFDLFMTFCKNLNLEKHRNLIQAYPSHLKIAFCHSS